jgi:hypothetical protein
MKVRGPNGLVFDVPETVSRSMVAAGHVEDVPDTEGMKLDQVLTGVHPEEAPDPDKEQETEVATVPEPEPEEAPEAVKPRAKRARKTEDSTTFE